MSRKIDQKISDYFTGIGTRRTKFQEFTRHTLPKAAPFPWRTVEVGLGTTEVSDLCDFDGFRRAVEGAQCLGLLAQEYRRDGDLVSPANVLFLQVAPGRWLRFFLDAGVFFWREVPAAVGITDAAPGDSYPLVPASAPGLVGSRVKAAELRAVPPDGARLALRFASGAGLALVNETDESRLELEP